MSDEEKKLEYIESVFEKYGAKPVSDQEKADDSLRQMYLYNGNYYRVGKMPMEDESESYIVFSSIDNEKYAKVGLLEDIDAVPFSTPEAELEKLVRYIFGIEPYPDDYYK